VKSGGTIDSPRIKLAIDRLANFLNPSDIPDSTKRQDECLEGVLADGD
jgi:hypothetical protein